MKTAALLTSVGATLVVALVPTGNSALTGSGQLNDVVQMTTATGTIAASALTSSSGSPAASSSPFSMHNSGSNVDTYIRYDWSTTPYYGSDSGQTSIALRGTTYYITDLLWFKQEIVSGASATTTSEYFSPLKLNNAATNSRATFTATGNACTGWTGSAAGGFSATAAGTLTFKYHAASSQTDDTPSTSQTFYYCLDTTNDKVYLGTSAAFASATLVSTYTANSAVGTTYTYMYEFLQSGGAEGNTYCLNGETGSGTSATPDLVQCQKMTYSLLGSAYGKLYPLFDPPAYFPSGSQSGASSVLTYALSGTQWNPYAYTTTNSA